MLLPTNKSIEKIPDPRSAKEHNQSFIRKKNMKSVKQSETIIYQPKTLESPQIFYINSVITEHSKTSHKLSKIKEVGSNSSLDSGKKSEKIM